jgi:hypothetical protein
VLAEVMDRHQRLSAQGKAQEEENHRLAANISRLKEERARLEEQLASMSHLHEECVSTLTQIQESGRNSEVSAKKLGLTLAQAKKDSE